MTKTFSKVFSLALILALVLSALPMQSAKAAPHLFANPSTTVFINEIHYDNTGTDAGEAIEVAGPAGTDLTGWSIVLYNGTGGVTYDADALSGVIANQQGGYGTVVITYPSNGIQNGAPDAIALINASNTVVQFLSYEGTVAATNGPANGLTSTDIGVSQVGTEVVGSSLQLTGTGDNYGDFAWSATTAHTFGNPNTGQNFGVVDAEPSVLTTSPANGATNVALVSNITVNFSEAVDVVAGTITVECPAGTVVASNAIVDNLSSVVIDPVSDLPSSTTCAINVAASGVTDEDTNDPPDNMLANFNAAFTTAAPVSTSEVVISQIYGGAGCGTAGCSTYTNDYIELYNRSANTVNITGWSVQYASAAGTSWQTTALSGSIAPGQYYLVQEGGNVNGVSPLPTPNATGAINMSATAAKVALVNSTTALSGSGCPIGGSIVDFVGYGATANCSEGGAPAPAPSTTTAIFRAGSGATDTDNNAADFATGAPSPRNTPPPNPSLTITDVSVSEGNSGTTSFDFTVNLSSPANSSGVTFDIATQDNSATSPSDFTAKSLTGQTIPVGGSNYSFSVLVNGDIADEPDETFFVNVTNVTGATISDGQGQGTITNDDVDFCAQSYTPIYQIQGSGPGAAITGTVTTKGVVVGDFEGTAAASGFYLQDLTGDGDVATSDGIFVFTGATSLVNAGDVVRVTGYARERFNQTTLNGSNSNTAAVTAASIINCGTGSVNVTDVEMPFASSTYLESFEGMLVRFPQSLVISEYFNYDQFGEIVLALPLEGEPRPFSGTALDAPGAAANARTLANSLRRITLDDVQSAQNPATLRHPNGAAFALDNRFRGGDLVQNAIGVLGYDFNLYRIVPTGPADYTEANPRPAAPEPVGGTVRVAAMNTLNFFITADYPTGNSLDNKCGPLQTVECRGWDFDQPLEFTRQRDKLLAALSGLNADVIGLNELENTVGVDILGDPTNGVVAGLNMLLGPNTYSYIDTGVIGTDAIRVGLIYKPAVVTPVGVFKTLTSAVDPRFIDTRSRPALAQTFEVDATGARFTVVVNHLKSKGSGCGSGDDDTLNGQGNCNGTRTLAAQALVDWLATDPTGSGDPDFLIMGDLNSYAMENPITTIKNGADDTEGTSDDFTNLIAQHQGIYAYSYTFDGQAGYLDHALGSSSIVAQVTGAADWHINSDEPDVVDYDTTFKPPAQEALYEANPYRSSDHDSLVVGLIPNAPPTVDAGGPYSVNEGSSVTLTASGSDPNGGTLTYAWDLDNNGSFETSGQSVSFSAALLDGPSSYTVKVQATDPLGLSAESTTTVNVTNVVPSVNASFASNSVSCGPNNSTLTVNFSDPGIADTHTAVINWGDGNTQTVSSATSPLSLQHTYALAGSYTATISVSDDDGGTGNATASETVNFNTTGFNQPINANGTSVFKYNSTIPVKISFTNCDGSIPANLAPTIKLTMISGATPGLNINEPISTSAADTTGVMRFSTNQYIYNLATKPLPDPSATYLITVTIPYNGQTVTVQFGLKP